MGSWIILACFLIFVVLLVKKNKNKSKNLPPGPPGLPIIGNLHQLGALPHRSLHSLSQRYGPLMYLKLGTVPTFVVSSPDTVKQVLKTYDLNCCTRPPLSVPGRLTYNYADLVFSPYDEYWRELRKMCTLELYSTKRVQSFRHIREEEIAAFVDLLNQAALTQTPFNLGRKSLSLSGSVICRLGFGIGLQGSKFYTDGYEELIFEAMRILGSFAVSDFFPYVGWIVDWLTGLHARREKVFHALDAFYEHAIEHHLKNKSQEGKEDIIDKLLELEKAGLFRLTRNHIKGILMNILLAGIDTSAQTIEWVMTRLIANPRVMKKVQAEVRDRIRNKEKITEEDIEQLDYLNMVIKETFRLHPGVTLLVPRQTVSDFQVNGYNIPAKARIQVNVWTLGHDPEIWKDPEEFIPERFLGKDIDYKGQSYELLPFGSGRRICPGMAMGMALVHMTLINILYRFDWKLPEGMTEKDVSFEEKYGLTNTKKVPLVLVPVRTQWS